MRRKGKEVSKWFLHLWFSNFWLEISHFWFDIFSERIKTKEQIDKRRGHRSRFIFVQFMFGSQWVIQVKLSYICRWEKISKLRIWFWALPTHGQSRCHGELTQTEAWDVVAVTLSSAECSAEPKWCPYSAYLPWPSHRMTIILYRIGIGLRSWGLRSSRTMLTCLNHFRG